MSLYGNVRRIGSQQFQFDRIYPTRVAMDQAMVSGSDGVHVGRFVLIEYGQRYEILNDETITRQQFNPETKQLEEVEYPKWKERDTFAERRQADQAAYGSNYDSTVWQKIYSEGYEKYIMVAELNAILPKLDIDVEGSLIYSSADASEADDDIYDAFNKKVENIKVDLNKPYFDQYQDTEMAYLLHYPMPLQLNVDADSIDFNANGFNIFYSVPKDPSESYIHWLTDGFYGDNYDAQGNPGATGEDIKYPRTNLSALLSSKTLRMHMPVFGNTVADLYDLIYGHPAYERDDNNEVIIKPNGEPQIAYYRTPGGNYLDVHGHILKKIDNKYVIVNDAGNPIDADGNEITSNYQVCDGDLVLETLRPYFKPYRDKYPYIVDPSTERQKGAYSEGVPDNIIVNGEKEVEVAFDEDGNKILRTPLNDTDDNMYWTKFVPNIGDILTNNSAGLAALLTELFGIRNPLTGEIKYWLLNDWTAEQYNVEGNTPTIRNKPEVVTYLTETKYQDLDGLFNSEEHNENGQRYSSQRKKWLKGTNITNSDIKIPIYSVTGNPVKDLNGNEIIDTVGYTENYQYYTVTKNQNGDVLAPGHWYTDINSWALRRVSNLPQNLGLDVPSITLLDPVKYENSTGEVYEGIILNSSASSILVTQTAPRGYTVAINAKLEATNQTDKVLRAFSRTNNNENIGQWLGFDLKVTEYNILKLKRGTAALTASDLQESQNFMLYPSQPDNYGHILQWVNATELKNQAFTVTISNTLGEMVTITFTLAS